MSLFSLPHLTLTYGFSFPSPLPSHLPSLSTGAEGSVFRGRWHHIDVAVKEMHPQSSSFSRLASIAQDLTHTGQSTVLEGIMKEVQALIDVSQHPNIVRFIGE